MTRNITFYVKDILQNMRDKVIHFYFGVDKEVIWFVVKDRIPAIRPLIERTLKELEHQTE